MSVNICSALKTIFYENDWFSKFKLFINMFVEISPKWKVTFRLSRVENVQAFEVLEKSHLQCHEFSPCIMWHLNAMQVTPYLTGNLRSNIFYVILDSTKVAVIKLNFACYCSDLCPKKWNSEFLYILKKMKSNNPQVFVFWTKIWQLS